jgi:hypothetical protein
MHHIGISKSAMSVDIKVRRHHIPYRTLTPRTPDLVWPLLTQQHWQIRQSTKMTDGPRRP